MYVCIFVFYSELFGNVNTGINFDNYDKIPVEVSGENCPQPLTSFDECDFASMLQENIKVITQCMYTCKYVHNDRYSQ